MLSTKSRLATRLPGAKKRVSMARAGVKPGTAFLSLGMGTPPSATWKMPWPRQQSLKHDAAAAARCNLKSAGRSSLFLFCRQIRNRGLGRGQPRHRHPEGRAGDISEAELMAELDRVR